MRYRGKARKPTISFIESMGPGILIPLAIFFAIIVVMLSSDVGGTLQGCVAVVEINGEISMQRIDGGLFSETLPNAEDVAQTINEVAQRGNVEAILVKINSPGGSVVGSRLIRQELKNAQVPTVAYLSEVAASGGYYIASGADYIVSDPNTITGSIGVIAVFADARELLEKVGVNITAVTSGRNKGMGSFFEGLDNESRAIVQGIINETYEEFVSVVEEGRGSRLDLKKFKEIADGRILSGRQALEVGLVDELGTPQRALEKAKELAGNDELTTCPVRVRARSSGFSSMKTISSLLQTLSGGLFLR